MRAKNLVLIMVSIAKRQDCSQPFPDDDQIFRICSDEKAPLRFYSLVSGIIVSAQAMNYISNFVSLHPYFKVHPGKLDAFKAGLPAFVEKTKTERKNLFYDFTISGDDVLCREVTSTLTGSLCTLRMSMRC